MLSGWLEFFHWLITLQFVSSEIKNFVELKKLSHALCASSQCLIAFNPASCKLILDEPDWGSGCNNKGVLSKLLIALA